MSRAVGTPAEVREWEDRAILNLAKVGLQNECKDRKIFRRIADPARLLTLVPENLWQEISWSEPEEDD